MLEETFVPDAFRVDAGEEAQVRALQEEGTAAAQKPEAERGRERQEVSALRQQLYDQYRERRDRLAGPIQALRGWDYRWSADSVAQTLAMFWGKTLFNSLKASPGEPTNRKYMRLDRDTSSEQKLKALS